jgi:peptidyl-prolyl cis-trans isomerase B (cyclophilin B)
MLAMATVILRTNLGNITLEVDEQAAPKTAQNFLDYCKSGFYTNTVFHRVIDGFMIQGGGMNLDLSSKTTNRPIPNEANTGLKNTIGTVAMARTSDPHSATAQFFINVANNDFLNFKSETPQGWGYCAFAKVTDGMDTVTKISHVNTVNRGAHQDVPEVNVVIESVEIVNSTVATEASTV